MKPRAPQLALRLGAGAAEPVTTWQDGTEVPYLGATITLQLSTDQHEAMLDGETLHLPLPPEASERQIRDAAEAWLRREAERYLSQTMHQLAAAQGKVSPRLALSFAAKGHWAQAEPDCLRCNWRLIEHSPAVIEQVLQRALGSVFAATATPDLFSLV